MGAGEKMHDAQDPLPGASTEERALIADFLATKVSGVDQHGTRKCRTASPDATLLRASPRLSRTLGDEYSHDAGFRNEAGSTTRQVVSRLEIGYSLLHKSADEVLLRAGLPRVSFDLTRAAVLEICGLLCRRRFEGGDLGDVGFEVNRRQPTESIFLLRDYPAFLESVADAMGYEGSERGLLRQHGTFKVRVKGSPDPNELPFGGDHSVAGETLVETEKNLHIDHADSADQGRLVATLWGPRTWFLLEGTPVSEWLRQEVQAVAKKRQGKERKVKPAALDFDVQLQSAAHQCAAVIEQADATCRAWDSVTGQRLRAVGTSADAARPIQIVHAVPTSAEVQQLGFGMPGTRNLLAGVPGAISRIVVVVDGLPFRQRSPQTSELS